MAMELQWVVLGFLLLWRHPWVTLHLWSPSLQEALLRGGGNRWLCFRLRERWELPIMEDQSLKSLRKWFPLILRVISQQKTLKKRRDAVLSLPIQVCKHLYNDSYYFTLKMLWALLINIFFFHAQIPSMSLTMMKNGEFLSMMTSKPLCPSFLSLSLAFTHTPIIWLISYPFSVKQDVAWIVGLKWCSGWFRLELNLEKTPRFQVGFFLSTNTHNGISFCVIFSREINRYKTFFSWFRNAFSGFDAETIAKLSDKQMMSISSEYGIDISRVRGVVDNSNRILEVIKLLRHPISFYQKRIKRTENRKSIKPHKPLVLFTLQSVFSSFFSRPYDRSHLKCNFSWFKWTFK